jgi:hypothetical protein
MKAVRGVAIAVIAAGLIALAMSRPPKLRADAGVAFDIQPSGTGVLTTGDFTPSSDGQGAEFQGSDSDGGAAAFNGFIGRSLSNGPGEGSSANSGKKAKSNPVVDFSFEGLNHYQQRYARGGNQFSIEPPDQGLCVGNGFVVEPVNDVVNVFNTAGESVLPDNTATNIVSGFPRNVNHAVDLNSFYGYAPAINRSTGIRGQEVTDPSCLYDADTGRFFVVALTLETVPTTGALTTQNHLDLAVSNSGNPAGSWTIYRINVTNDGSNPNASNKCPCLGDYPHIGADANGFYITTNAYPWRGNGFDGAQIYAISKWKLANGGTITVVHLNTFGMVPVPSDAGSSQPGFTVWPAQSPDGGSYASDDNGTEYFLSSNAADESQNPVSGAAGTHTSNQLVIWSLTNTASLGSSSPSLNLSNRVISVNQYGVPPKAKQPGSGTAPGVGTPQGHCINDSTTATIAGVGCWRLLFNPPEPAANEVISRPDSNDTRMQQVTFANGKLWGALDTAVSFESGPNRAGVAWFILNPSAAKVVMQGTLGVQNSDLTYPAIGVTASGRGVIAMTELGDSTYPSAVYAGLDAIAGVGDVMTAAAGATTDDGFTSYKSQVGNPPRTRWGDYGAAAVDGNSIWIASEYIAQGCTYTNWGGPFFVGGTGDNLLGTCGGASHGPGARSALANWSTRISKVTP